MDLAKEQDIQKAVNAKLAELKKQGPRLLQIAFQADFTAAQAAEYIPQVQGCRIVKDNSWHQCWTVYYPRDVAPFSHTKVWNIERTSLEAMVTVIRWSWTSHRQQCPFDLAALLAAERKQ